MALDTNIALGVRPIEQPNMLGQMAQAMQIRQAQQGFEEQNALRNFYAQGGDVSTPKGRQQLMSTSPAAGIKLIGQQSEINARDIGTAEKTIGLFKNQIGNVNDRDSALRWASALYDNPLTGPLMQSMAPREQALGAIPSDPAGLEAWKRKAGLTADKLFEDANSIAANKARIQAAGISAAPANARLVYDIANPAQYHFTGEDGTLMVAPQRGGGAATPVPMGGSSAPPSQITIGGGSGVAPMGGGSSIMNPTSVNALAPSASVNQNALITQAQPTPAPTYAKVRATPVTKAVLDPTDPAGKRMIEVDANTYVAGTGLGADGKGAPPKGVLGVSASQIPANYMRDPNNPDGVIPVPGSPADPNSAVPPGYRKTAKGFEAIPGGPADPKVQAAQTTVKLDAKTIATREAAYPQATLAVKNGEQNATQLIKEVNDLAEHKGLSGITGLIAGRTMNFSGDARSAQADLKKIIAEGTLKVLTDLRAASKTGGALGNTSNKDIDLLQNAAAALDQTQNTEDFKRKLKDFAFTLERTKQNMREAYDMTYEYKTPANGGFTYIGKE